MWIFTNRAFLSVVADRDDPTKLLVRGRCAAHIRAVFPNAKIRRTDAADYRWRTSLPRVDVAVKIAETLASVTYENFKDAIEPPELHDAAMRVWAIMHSIQEPAPVRHKFPQPRLSASYDPWWEREFPLPEDRP